MSYSHIPARIWSKAEGNLMFSAIVTETQIRIIEHGETEEKTVAEMGLKSHIEWWCAVAVFEENKNGTNPLGASFVYLQHLLDKERKK